jgi:hypothetical protein
MVAVAIDQPLSLFFFACDFSGSDLLSPESRAGKNPGKKEFIEHLRSTPVWRRR